MDTSNTRPSSPTSDADDLAAIATLAGLTGGLGEGDLELLDLLTNPANDPAQTYATREAMLTDIEDMVAYSGDGGWYNAEIVAGRIREHFYRIHEPADGGPTGAGDFHFAFQCDSEGTIHSYVVGVNLGYDLDARLLTVRDPKHITYDRNATGIQAALGYARALMADYRTLVTKAQDRGLLPTSA